VRGEPQARTSSASTRRVGPVARGGRERARSFRRTRQLALRAPAATSAGSGKCAAGLAAASASSLVGPRCRAVCVSARPEGAVADMLAQGLGWRCHAPFIGSSLWFLENRFLWSSRSHFGQVIGLAKRNRANYSRSKNGVNFAVRRGKLVRGVREPSRRFLTRYPRRRDDQARARWPRQLQRGESLAWTKTLRDDPSWAAHHEHCDGCDSRENVAPLLIR
jgi:hypothetical protein